MSTAHWIQTIIEVLLLLAVIASMVYEPTLIKWEEMQKEKMLKAFNKRKEYRR